MKGNEAEILLRDMQEYRELTDRVKAIYGDQMTLKDMVDVMERIIREPGRKDPVNARILTYDEVAMWDEYRKSGTPEELKAASKYLRLVKKHGTVGKAIEACAEYEDIGTVEELKKIKEKDIAKPVIKNSNGVFCPVCLYWINHRQYVINAGEDHPNRCEWCGQKLKWEETDED